MVARGIGGRMTRKSESNRSDGGEPSIGGEDAVVASRIARILRDAGFVCNILNPVPTKTLRSDRIVVLLSLTLVTALAWSYLLWLSADMDMGGMDMTGFRMIPSGMSLMVPEQTPWRAMEFAFVFAMWTVMMVGMMMPSVAPMILMYARVGRQTEPQGAPLTATVWFVAGYLFAWAAFALPATLVQWILERTGLLDSAMASTNNVLGDIVFALAGVYQWTRLKEVCLAQCQTPFAFLMQHGGFRSDAPGCIMLGLRHGAYCLGCCWALMSLLFVGGVMNTLWILFLAFLILLEKITFSGPMIARLAGIALVAADVWLLSMPMY
jgi:predicted metal-binding membrane protein